MADIVTGSMSGMSGFVYNMVVSRNVLLEVGYNGAEYHYAELFAKGLDIKVMQQLDLPRTCSFASVAMQCPSKAKSSTAMVVVKRSPPTGC